MPVDVLLGLQWGDEGKGKIIDTLSPRYEIVARFQGGPNAGHTLLINGKKFIFHTLPSGVIHTHTKNILGTGMVIDPVTLRKEIEMVENEGINVKNSILISEKAHLILPSHKYLDAFFEKKMGENKIGSTLKGIGPAYQDKISRVGLRMGHVKSNHFHELYQILKQRHFALLDDAGKDLSESEEGKWSEAIEFLKNYPIVNTENYLNESLKDNRKVLAEGAQGTLLDIDYGTYPYVTSSSTIAAGACTGLGISPKYVNEVLGVFKAYTTRVGEGPFPTEQVNEIGEFLTEKGCEYGSTTGRKRRCGWLDLVALKYAIMINGVTSLIITKSDVLSFLDEIKVCSQYSDDSMKRVEFSELYFGGNIHPEYQTFKSWKTDISQIKEYDELPSAFKDYLKYIENETGLKIRLISTGPDRNQMIQR